MPRNPQLHKNNRQRMKQRFENDDLMFTAYHPHEVLEMALFLVYPRQNTNETAHFLIDTFGSIENAVHAPLEELVRIPSVGEAAAVKLRIFGALYDELTETVPPPIYSSDSLYVCSDKGADEEQQTPDKNISGIQIKEMYMQKFESSDCSFEDLSKRDMFCILLAFILKDGARIEKLANRLDKAFDTVGRMVYAEDCILKKYGLGSAECYRIKLLSAFMNFICFEKYKRLSAEEQGDSERIKKYICEIMKYKLFENMYAFLFDEQMCIKEVRQLANGTVTSVILDHSELEKLFAAFSPYKYFMIAHNHADRSLPSLYDVSSTSTIRMFGKWHEMVLLASYVVRGEEVSEVEDGF